MRKFVSLLLFSLCIPAFAKDAMLLNRIGPTKSELYVANSDGSGEHKLLNTNGFDYHATYSYDGKWIVFTGERYGLGQADIFRAHPDGAGLERLTDSPALDDQGVLSPDDSKLAFVSTREKYRAGIWILDLKTKKATNLTGAPGIQGDLQKPDGFFRPSWSPDGQWIAFTSDRNTEWKGHDNGQGWEHLQELAIYIIHPDGTGFKQVTASGITSSSPKWSADSKQLVYAEMPVEVSWLARVEQLSKLPFAASQIVSLDLASGKKTELTTGPGIKLGPQFLPDGRVGYVTKSAQDTKIVYTSGSAGKFASTMLRSPSWSPDGKQVVYEKIDNTPFKQKTPLYSWDPKYDYFYTDVFPSYSKDGTLLVTAKDVDSSIATMNTDGSNKKVVFKSATHCQGVPTSPCGDMDGVAFAPSWSPDGQSIVFGFGGYLRLRNTAIAKLMLIKRDGAGLQELTSGAPNAGFPSFSPDGKEVVYRSWAENEDGLRIMNIETKQVRVLTKEPDNLPEWQPGGDRIVFTRKVTSASNPSGNFDIFTIKADGTDLNRLTTYPASDAHAVWSYDGKRIMWDSGEYGFRDESPLYDNSFQPYGSIWVMDADGSNKRQITQSHWEDSMPVYVPPYAK